MLHSSSLVAAAAVGGLGSVSLRVSDGIEVEAVDLEMIEGQEEPNDNFTILTHRANFFLACTTPTLPCLVSYQLSLPNGAATFCT